MPKIDLNSFGFYALDMAIEGKGRVFKYKQHNRNVCIIQVPYSVGYDSQFPFNHKQEVIVRIEGKKIIVEAVE
jgi:hypothetical protein